MKYLISLCVCVLLAGSFSIVSAETTPAGDPGETTPPGVGGTVTLKNPLAAGDITQLFESIIDILLIFAVPIIVFFIIYAGFLYVTARGNEDTIKKAHAALLYALIGGLLILGARVLIDIISGTVDVFRD